MFNQRGRITEMMQQFFPFPVACTFPETGRMIFQGVPSNRQQILIVVFNTLLQFVLDISLRSFNDRLRAGKRFFECG